MFLNIRFMTLDNLVDKLNSIKSQRGGSLEVLFREHEDTLLYNLDEVSFSKDGFVELRTLTPPQDWM